MRARGPWAGTFRAAGKTKGPSPTPFPYIRSRSMKSQRYASPGILAAAFAMALGACAAPRAESGPVAAAPAASAPAAASKEGVAPAPPEMIDRCARSLGGREAVRAIETLTWEADAEVKSPMGQFTGTAQAWIRVTDGASRTALDLGV